MTHPIHPVLIIRAQPGAAETAQRVEQMGLSAILSPVLIMQERPDTVMPSAEQLSGLVFTSANGVRAYSKLRLDRSLPAWCVGPATAAAARAAGFSDVRESAGNALDLADFIARETAPTHAPLLHIANAAAKGDLKLRLTDLGFATEFAPLYDMRPAASLSDAADEVLGQNAPCILLIHSAKGAERFAELCQGRRLNHLVTAAISQTAAEPLKSLDLKTIEIAPSPNEDGLFQALNAALATLSA